MMIGKSVYISRDRLVERLDDIVEVKVPAGIIKY